MLIAALAALSVAVLLAFGMGGTLTPGVAQAAPDDVVNIPDANLKAAANAALTQLQPIGTPARASDQDITEGEAETVTNFASVFFTAPLADLTGLEAFTNLQEAHITPFGNTFTDLGPLTGLTSLTHLTIQRSEVSDLSPLSGLTGLVDLNLPYNQISNVAPLSGLTNLTSLNLSYNQIRNVQGLPSAPRLTRLLLNSNNIKDVSPLVGKFDPDYLSALNLGTNKIEDITPIIPMGLNGSQLGASGVDLRNNRIKDLSVFADWPSKPTGSRARGQEIFVGAYMVGGVNVVLRTSNDVVPTPAAGVATYDMETNLLTITDPAAESVSVGPNWTIMFSDAPVEPGDDDGPQLQEGDTGDLGTFRPLDVPQIGEFLVVADLGPALAACPNATAGGVSYVWLRDGEEITGTPHAWVDSNYGFNSFRNFGLARRSINSYNVSASDVGHRLSVRVTCVETGEESNSESTAVVLAEQADRPLVQDLASLTHFTPYTGAESLSYQLAARSGVVGDPTNVTIPIQLVQQNESGQLVDPSQIEIALTEIRSIPASCSDVSGTLICPPKLTTDDVEITGTGATRTIAITPRPFAGDERRYLHNELTFKLTGSTGKTTEVALHYRASEPTTLTSRVLLGSSDASTAIGVGDGHLLVADDEKRVLRLYDGETSGREVAEFEIPKRSPATGQLTVGKDEIDYEASARKGDMIWWFGSHGKDKDGKLQAGRETIVQTELTGSGANAKITPVGVFYQGLMQDLVAWDQANGDRFGFYEGRRENGGPAAIARNGINLEAAEFSPDGGALYLGFRSPVVPATEDGKALIVPVTNLEDLTSREADKARFGEPILLELGGDSIREIRKNDAGEYLILSAEAGVAKASRPQKLWAWNGSPGSNPRELSTVLAPFEGEHTMGESAGAWEGIGEMPERVTPGAQIRLISDQGYARLHGSENKDDGNNWSNKARTDVFAIEGPAGVIAQINDPGAFPDQPANTIGAAREIVVASNGSHDLQVRRAYVTDEDGQSRDDFLISHDAVTGEDLAPGESGAIRVRFAPARVSTTSTATLVIHSNVPGGKTEVELTGISTTLPKGDPGDDGQDGENGQDGIDGENGVDGKDGANGEQGPVGPAGPQGAAGSLGPVGPQGPSGPQGVAGRDGRDGTFVFSVRRSRASVKRGRAMSLALRLSNNTTARARPSRVIARAPRALRVRGKRVVRVAPLRAGQSRTVRLRLRVGRDARVGLHRMRIQLKVGGRSAARTVLVRVKR